MMLWLLALLLTPTVPDHQLTPGMVRGLTTVQICATKWGKDERHVSKKDRAQVFAAYGISVDQRHLYVIDHLIPREIGGADDQRNLWPQLEVESHQKDRLERQMNIQLCAGRISLEEAQARMKWWNGQ